MKSCISIAVAFLLLTLSGCEDIFQPEGVGQPVQQVEENCWLVEIDKVDFSRDKVMVAKDEQGNDLALLTLEYLGKAIAKQAVLVYTRTASGNWRTDSIYVASVPQVQKGLGYAKPEECCSGGTLKYYPADNSYFYNDISEATEDDLSEIYVKRMADGSTYLKRTSLTQALADVQPVRLSMSGFDYPLVKIAGHLWTAENLRQTNYPDGVEIPSTGGSWSSRLPLMGQSLRPDAGSLYNFYAAQKLSFGQWRLPSGKTGGDWSTLEAFVDGASSLKKSGSNVTGFSLVPFGRIAASGETYEPEDDDMIFWTSTETSDTKAVIAKIFYKTSGDVIQYESAVDKRSGFAVRLMKRF